MVGAVVVLGCADSVWAWGPATHVHLAGQVLGHVGLLSAGLAALLVRHARHFIYGNIAADVVFGKRFSKVKHSCHKWSLAHQLLAAADSPQQQAFAHGYLAHLAADVVAHNKYLPRQMLTTGTTVNFGHLFWEIRADSQVSPACWDVLATTLQQPFPQHVHLLEQHLHDTFLPFEANLLIFNRMNMATCADRWRALMGHWGRRSRWPLDPQLLRAYHAESLAMMRIALEQSHHTWLTRQDPAGAAAFEQVRRDRRVARRLAWRGVRGQLIAGRMAAPFEPVTLSPVRQTSVA